jgi:hypothetical protein
MSVILSSQKSQVVYLSARKAAIQENEFFVGIKMQKCAIKASHGEMLESVSSAKK